MKTLTVHGDSARGTSMNVNPRRLTLTGIDSCYDTRLTCLVLDRGVRRPYRTRFVGVWADKVDVARLVNIINSR